MPHAPFETARLVRTVLAPLKDVIGQLSPQDFSRPIQVLAGASVGAHVRHILDMYQCLENGIDTGVVNYEHRKRDQAIECDPARAGSAIEDILKSLREEDLSMYLEGRYSETDDQDVRVASSYHREVLYNLEHSIHHMALIRIGLRDMGFLDLPDSFGVAPATIKYRTACAQ